METDPVKQRSRQKEALQLLEDKQNGEEGVGGGDDHPESPHRSTTPCNKDTLQPTKRNIRGNRLFSEDIIDGFAILSFRTLEDLQIVADKHGCIENRAPLVEDTLCPDILLEHKHEVDKSKKRKAKKNLATHNCNGNSVDILEKASLTATTTSSCSGSNSDNTSSCSGSNSDNISSSNIKTTEGGNLNRDINDGSRGDGDEKNNHCNNNNSVNNGVLEKSACISRDRMGGTSPTTSDVISVTAAEANVKGLASEGSLKSCTTIPAASSSSSPTSPTPISNGDIGPDSFSITSVPHVAVATTTTTPSRPGSTSITSTAVTTAVPSQSVIHTTPYFSAHSSSNPSHSPRSSLSNSHNKRPVPYSHQHHHNQWCDSSVNAGTVKYSPNHRSNQIHQKTAHHHLSPTFLGRASSSPVHLQNPHQNSSSENYPNLQPLNTRTNVNYGASNSSKQHTINNFLFDGHHSGSEYPLWYSADQSDRRPDSHGGHHYSSHEATESRSHQQCSIGNPSLLTTSGGSRVPTTTTVTTSSISKHPLHQKNLHHSRSNSSSLRPSSPLSKSNLDLSHQDNQRCSSSSSNSSLAHLAKRSCRSSPSLSSSSSVLTANGSPENDSPKHLTSSVSSKSQKCRQECSSSSPNRAGKDHSDIRIKDHPSYHISSSHSHHLNRHHKDREKERQREKDRDRDRHQTAVSVGVSLPQPVFSTPKPTWPSTQVPLYDAILQFQHPSPSPGIASLGPYPSPSTSLPPPLFTLPLAPSISLQATGASTLSTGMFASPIPPAPSCLPPTPSLSSHQTGPSPYSADNLIRNPDFLHQDLNNRLLAHRDSNSVALSPSSFIRAETHQHQHQHLHSHMHQHTYGGLSAGPMVPPTPPLMVPNYNAAFTSLLPQGPSGATLASSLQGAFQPKNVMVPGQVLAPFRDREKGVPQPGLTPTQKKQGKWCAVHVRVAWEIFHRQQKKLQRDQDGTTSSSTASSALKSGVDLKPLEPLLRPPSSLLHGGSAIIRPPESPLLTSVARSLPDGIAHASPSFMSPAANLGLAPFPRPSAYTVPSLLNPLGFSGLGGNMFASVHDMVPLQLSSSLNPSSNEWNRLHRTPSTFPSWPRSETEKERERDLRKEDERERERRGSLNHQLSGLDDSRHKDAESRRPKSRSRSRSPLRNGRIDHHSKSELGSYEKQHYDDRRPHSTSASGATSRLKEDRRSEEMSSLPHHLAEREKLERFHREKLEKDRFERERHERDRVERERIEKEKLLQSAAAAEREKLLQVMEQREKFFQTGGYLGLNPFNTGYPTHPGFLDRRVGLMGHTTAGYPFLERAPVPTAMWNPYDKSAADIFHRLEVERERERIAMMSRLSSIPPHLAVLEQERLKDQILREQQEREYELRKQYFDRSPVFTAERLRAADPLALGVYFPRTVSPMFAPGGLASLKSNSPHGMSGVPPPLIPSSSSVVAASMLSARSHDNSPSSSSKSKGCSPADSTSDLKDKREGNSTDLEAQSR